MLIYHASKEIVEFPEIRKTKFTKDFSWGFYSLLEKLHENSFGFLLNSNTRRIRLVSILYRLWLV